MGPFSSGVACEVCGVTQRMLDHWVAIGVVTPTGERRCHRKDKITGSLVPTRRYYRFTFNDLVSIQLVQDLRDTGVWLQKIRFAIENLKDSEDKKKWASWLLTDGKSVFKPTSDRSVLESLTKGEKGQFVLSVIALAATADSLKKRLEPFSKSVTAVKKSPLVKTMRFRRGPLAG